jgi:hypothetical protein
MLNRILTTLLLMLLPAAQLRAAPIIQFDGLPAALIPGGAVTFDVRLTATALAVYNIELLLSGSEGAPGVDYYFDTASQASSDYVFAALDEGNFLPAIQPPATRDRLTLSDFLAAGQIDAVAGINDRVATVTLRTSPAFAGTLSLSVNAASLELFDGDFADVPDFAAASTPTAQIAVPEPAASATLLSACGALVARRRRSSAAQQR